MTIEYKEIYDANYPASQIEFQEAILDGWRIDENNLPHAGMFAFDIKLVREKRESEVFVNQAVVFPEQAAVKRVGRPVKAV